MIGKTFLNRYEVQRVLGEGGMGKVYLARQVDLGRQVVVKVMHDHVAEDPKFRERFQRETLLMARFHHPYAVTLYDASLNDPAGACIVMEYVKGGNLEALLAKVKKMTAPRVGKIISQLCDVLQAAHDEGIIHRDLKPANLMVVDPDTPKERIKVMDFGLAKLIDDEQLSKVTDTAVDFAVGTPAYICPEQVRGEQMDHRGDLYSVGVMAYELLCGQVPFHGASGMDVLLAHATERPPTFAEIGLHGWVPGPVEEVVRQTLAKDPDDRPQSARELADLFAAALRRSRAKADSEWRAKGLPPTNFDDDRNDSDDAILLLETTPSPKRAESSGSDSARTVVQGAADLQRRAGSPARIAASSNREQHLERASLPFVMEAWMPESIALMKLRGFVQDNGGRVLECSGGRVVMKLNGTKAYSAIGWLGLGSKSSGPLEVELKLVRVDPKRENQLNIHVLFYPQQANLLGDQIWCDRCLSIFVELRAYLMGGAMN